MARRFSPLVIVTALIFTALAPLAMASHEGGFYVVVRSDGSPTTVSLDAGEYLFTASGTYKYGTQATEIADAEYYSGCQDWVGSRLDILINDEGVHWGSCDSANHTYTVWRTCLSTCQWTFRIEDSFYGDNSGSLTVHVRDYVGSNFGWIINPKTHPNPDGSVTVYNDSNGTGQLDEGEALATVPRTPNLATRGRAETGITVYDDRNHNGTQEPDEPTFAATPPLPPDADGDHVLDALEPALCGPAQNRNLHVDGECAGSDWTAPTVEGVLNDIESVS